MSDPGMRTDERAHASAADAFVKRALRRFDADIESLYVFGSTAREEAEGLSSDVDVLVVLADELEETAVADELRDLAYDVMLEYGPVVELHVLSKADFVESRERGNPFLETVVSEGRSYA
ncbi:MAG: nucleotidyltransferase domain-containing protein [Halobacteriales archaeon]